MTAGHAAPWLAAALVGSAVLLLGAGARGSAERLRRIGAAGSRGAPGGAGAVPDRPRRPRVALASAAAGVAVVALVGGVAGVVSGAAVAGAVAVALRRLEPRSVRERRTTLLRQAPDVADLLAACLASGAPLAPAVAAVARAVGEPAATSLRGVVATLDLGGDAVSAWSALAGEPGLAALARAIARSVDSGAPLGDVLPGIADDLRRSARVEAETAARAAGVRAVAPLAACFLPAFLLLGVVPVIASLAATLL